MTNIISRELIQALGLKEKPEIVKLAGNANDNYLIKTDDRGIVVKCLGEHTAENEELEGVYREHLAKNGLPVTPFIIFKNGKNVFSHNGHDYVALEYVEGAEARGKESAIAGQIGIWMARLHMLDYQSLPARVNWLDNSYLDRVLGVIHQDDDLVKELLHQNESFKDLWHVGLPEGIVHGDLHDGNIIIDHSNHIVTILDWEEVGILPLVLDLAGTVQAIAQNETGFNQEVFHKFFTAYQSIRPITQAEKDMFDEVVRYRSFIVYVWCCVKHSQGLMGNEKLSFFKRRYYEHPKSPTIF